MMGLIKMLFRPDRTLAALARMSLKLRKINRMELGIERKRLIRNAYLTTFMNTFLLGRYDSRNRIANIAGNRVAFCAYESLAILFHEIFEDQQYCFITDNERPFVVDCGSNIGMSVLYFKMLYPQAEVLAFEPYEKAFACLEENMRANGMRGVTLHQKALSNEQGEIDFYFDEDNPGSLIMSTKKERISKNKQVVTSVRLSTYIERDVDFLKIDVEGAEVEILEDLSNAGKLHYIKQMVMEYHHHILKDQDVLSQLLALLENAGFGYQIESPSKPPYKRRQFQNLLIYAYQKNTTA